jgi:hypothetical protein
MSADIVSTHDGWAVVQTLKGKRMLSAEGIVLWLIKEAVFFCVLMLALWGIGKIVTDGELAKWLRILAIVIIGGTMFVLLLRFTGIF